MGRPILKMVMAANVICSMALIGSDLAGYPGTFANVVFQIWGAWWILSITLIIWSIRNKVIFGIAAPVMWGIGFTIYMFASPGWNVDMVEPVDQERIDRLQQAVRMWGAISLGVYALALRSIWAQISSARTLVIGCGKAEHVRPSGDPSIAPVESYGPPA